MKGFRDFHLFSKGDTHFLLFPRSMKIYKLRGEDARILGLMEEGEPGRKSDLCRDVRDILAREAAVPDVTSKYSPGSGVVGLSLLISQECNLRCDYCYGYVDGEGYGKAGAFMSEQILNAVFAKFFTAHGARYNLGFFGGEPLLNFGLMESAAAKAEEWKSREIEVRFGITTNGTVMDDTIAAFFDKYIDTAIFSIDGEKEDHDRRRINRVGEGSHGKVLVNFGELREKTRSRLNIQAVITKDTAQRVGEVYDFLRALSPHSLEMNLAFVTKENPAYLDDDAYRAAVSGLVEANVHALTGLACDGPVLLMRYPLMFLSTLFLGRRGIHHCDAGLSGLSVAADGGIYPCHRFVGRDEFLMGNVTDDFHRTARFAEVRRLFASCTVAKRSACKECWARYLCGGACAYRSSYAGSGIETPDPRHCYFIKSMVERLIPEIIDLMGDPAKRAALVGRVRPASPGKEGVR